MTARKRPVLKLIGVAAVALACSGPAAAASPQKIYKDLADNGRLDGRYSRADIARAFNLQRVVRTDVREVPSVRRPSGVRPRAEAGGDRSRDRTIPFTELDLALLIVGGGPLLLIGIGLRRRVAPAPTAVRS